MGTSGMGVTVGIRKSRVQESNWPATGKVKAGFARGGKRSKVSSRGVGSGKKGGFPGHSRKPRKCA